jgi:hypothetical protein
VVSERKDWWFSVAVERDMGGGGEDGAAASSDKASGSCLAMTGDTECFRQGRVLPGSMLKAPSGCSWSQKLGGPKAAATHREETGTGWVCSMASEVGSLGPEASGFLSHVWQTGHPIAIWF